MTQLIFATANEGHSHMPKASDEFLFLSIDESCTKESEDELSPAISRLSFGIKPSLVIKKPSNSINLDQSGGKSDYNTNYDSSASESDEETQGILEEKSQMSEREYLMLTQKVFYLVQETKDSKHKGLLSPILLRNKMYDFLAERSLPSSDDMLFEECDFATSPQIRSYTDGMRKKKSLSANIKVKRSKSHFVKNSKGFSSLFSYLSQANC